MNGWPAFLCTMCPRGPLKSLIFRQNVRPQPITVPGRVRLGRRSVSGAWARDWRRRWTATHPASSRAASGSRTSSGTCPTFPGTRRRRWAMRAAISAPGRRGGIPTTCRSTNTSPAPRPIRRSPPPWPKSWPRETRRGPTSWPSAMRPGQGRAAAMSGRQRPPGRRRRRTIWRATAPRRSAPVTAWRSAPFAPAPPRKAGGAGTSPTPPHWMIARTRPTCPPT